MIRTADRLNNISEYYFSQKLREIDDLNKKGRQIINLGIGSPDKVNNLSPFFIQIINLPEFLRKIIFADII